MIMNVSKLKLCNNKIKSWQVKKPNLYILEKAIDTCPFPAVILGVGIGRKTCHSAAILLH